MHTPETLKEPWLQEQVVGEEGEELGGQAVQVLEERMVFGGQVAVHWFRYCRG
jgi:hypothetical protein